MIAIHADNKFGIKIKSNTPIYLINNTNSLQL